MGPVNKRSPGIDADEFYRILQDVAIDDAEVFNHKRRVPSASRATSIRQNSPRANGEGGPRPSPGPLGERAFDRGGSGI